MKKLVVAITFLLFVGMGVFYYSWTNNITINEETIHPYMDYADTLSEGKAQLNWKYLFAIDNVLMKKEGDASREERLTAVGNAFFDQNGTTYTLYSLDKVLNDFQFTEKEREKVNRILVDLKDEGIKPERLKEGTIYTTFIHEVKESAISNYKKTGILPSITISQAILESDWGRSALAKDANNLFGIKADRSWKGEIITLKTTEYYDQKIHDGFRSYATKQQSIDDHAMFLKHNPRYEKNGVFEGATYREQAKALEKAGYSTAQDENGEKIYASLLGDLIRQYNLQLIDSQVQEKMA